MKTEKLLALFGQIDPALIERAALPDPVKQKQEEPGAFAERIFAEAVRAPEAQKPKRRFHHAAAAAAILLLLLGNAGAIYGIHRMRAANDPAASASTATHIVTQPQDGESSVSEAVAPQGELSSIAIGNIVVEISPESVTPYGCTLRLANYTDHLVFLNTAYSLSTAGGQELEMRSPVPSDALRVTVQSGNRQTVQVDWGYSYGRLPLGQYDLSFELTEVTEDGFEKRTTYSTSFDIPTDLVRIPDVTGIPESDAVDTLCAAGFAVEIHCQTVPGIGEGIAYKTEPEPGSAVPKNGLVKLYVSGSPENTVPMNPVNMTFSLPQDAPGRYVFELKVVNDDGRNQTVLSHIIGGIERTWFASVYGSGKAVVTVTLKDVDTGLSAECGIIDMDFDAQTHSTRYLDTEWAVKALAERTGTEPEMDVTVTAEEVTPVSCELVFTNNSSSPGVIATFGMPWFLERDGQKLPLTGETEFEDIAQEIPPGGSVRMNVNWEDNYGVLSPGTYRIHVTCNCAEPYADFVIR